MTQQSQTDTATDLDCPFEGGDGLDPTEIHEVLSNERRVAVLQLLQRHDQYDVSELAEELAAFETGERPPPRNKRQSAYVTLHQTHLPKLDQMGIVQYDSRRKTVTLGQEESAAYADVVDAMDPARPDRTPDHASTRTLDVALAITVTGLCATVLGHIGPGPFPGSSRLLYAEMTLLVLLGYLLYRKGQANAWWFESDGE